MWGLLRRRSPSGFSPSSTAEEVTAGIDASGLVAVVTGASSGIGAETCRVLAMRGVHVVMGIRNSSAGARVRDEILKQVPAAKVEMLGLDLSSMSSVRRFAANFNALNLPLNILMHCFQRMALRCIFQRITLIKVTAIESGIEGRIVIVSSTSYRYSYREGIRFDKINNESRFLPYAQSKFANVLHSNLLSSNLKEQEAKVTVNSLHPGAAATNIIRHWDFLGVSASLGKFLVKVVEQLFPRRQMWGLLRRRSPSGFSPSSTAEEVTAGIDGSGLVAIVTGASSGIGAETCRVLAMRGVHVVMGVRNSSAGEHVRDEIVKQVPAAKIEMLDLDLSSMSSVRKFTENFNAMNLPLNILINNAGIAFVPFNLSEDGIELHFSTNHLGHFLLTDLLLEKMKVTATETGIEGRIEQDAKVAVNCLHPGAVATNIMRHWDFVNGMLSTVGKFFVKSVEQGAATVCYVALHPQIAGVTGKYFVDCNIIGLKSHALDMELSKRLWDFSLNLIH
uniref:Short-chain dehydrogenase TIC 32, chloroplastic n=1 Tax=Leersia perrieri TaxID=77586 RepID=A0A0D9W392_9ORYZ